jgi:ABC-type transport system involved in cytochrome bd biosynthesis fused ATPase/permease subunit
MKYVFYALLLIAAVLFGVFIGVGVLRDFGLVIGMFVLFPPFIFSALSLSAGEKKKNRRTKTMKKNAFPSGTEL